jgi:radical SAM/Cys-rich protein
MGSTLLARGSPLSSAAEQLRRLASSKVPPFGSRLESAGLAPLTATGIEVLQVNLGKLCNQSCAHCHVDAGPERSEQMSGEVVAQCLAALARSRIPTLDITGGAPELNAHFRTLVAEARTLGRHVIDRCNLTVLLLAPQRDLAPFLATQGVEVVASLPYFQAAQADAQRGEGVFEKSIRALQLLNSLGYAQPGSGLRLNLVHNPVGAFLPARQAGLEERFRRELERRHGIKFNSLYTITNMPISRYLDFLVASGNFDGYMERLANAFNPAAAAGVMCRSTLSVAWDGTLHDCDFNQMLALGTMEGLPAHIRDFDSVALAGRPIATANHCYGCTAGGGSSCGGALVAR